MTDQQRTSAMLNAMLQPWYDAVNDPARAQEKVLHRYLKISLPDIIEGVLG